MNFWRRGPLLPFRPINIVSARMTEVITPPLLPGKKSKQLAKHHNTLTIELTGKKNRQGMK